MSTQNINMNLLRPWWGKSSRVPYESQVSPHEREWCENEARALSFQPMDQPERQVGKQASGTDRVDKKGR